MSRGSAVLHPFSRGGVMGEFQKFALALIAPVGITIMGAILGIEQMFAAGLVFCGLVVASRDHTL